MTHLKYLMTMKLDDHDDKHDEKLPYGHVIGLCFFLGGESGSCKRINIYT